MTALEDHRSPVATSAPAETTQRRVPLPIDSVAPALLAGLATLVAVGLLVDLTQGAMSATLVAAIVALVASSPWLRTSSWELPTTRVIATSVPVMAIAGAVGAEAGGTPVRTIGQLGLAWAVAVVIVAVERRRSDADGRSALHVAVAAAAIGALAAIPALAGSVGVDAAVALLLAAPVAVVVLVATLSSPRSGADRLGRTATAVALGAVTGVVALATVTGDDLSVGLVAVLTVITIAIGGALVGMAVAVSGPPVAIPRWLPSAALGATAVAAGAGGGLLPIAAVGALLVVHQRDRVVAPIARAVDTSAVTARRVVAGLTVVAVGVRLWAPRGLWLDEATSVHQARLPFADMIRLIYREDNHPPLHHVLLWLDVRIVGDSELAVRLPAIALGALLVPMLYLTGRELFDRRVGVIAAAIGTVAPLAVWYGQEARMYSQFMLLALVTVYALVRILRGGGARWWIAFTVGSVAVVLTQYFAILHVLATLVVLAVEIVRRRGTSDARRLRRGMLGSIAAGAVALAPLVPFALYQVVHNQQSGFGFSGDGLNAGSSVVPPPSIYGFLTNVQWAVFGYQTDELTTRLVALWPIGLLLLLLALGRPRRDANRSLLLVAGLPIAAVFGASLFASKSRSLAEVRYFIGAVPILFVLLAAGITTVIASRRLQKLAVAGLLGSMALTLGLQETSDQNPRLYQYREAMADIRAERQPGDVVVYAPDYLDYVLEYYGPGVASRPLEDGLGDTDGRVFLVQGASFADSADASVEIAEAVNDLEARGLAVQARDEYAQITVWRLG